MRRHLVLLLGFLGYRLCLAAPLAPAAVPEPLKPWLGWVMYGEEEQLCPALQGQPQSRRCVWPTRLELNLDERGGVFTLHAQVDDPGWVFVPGDARRWPREVAVDGKPALLASRNDVPALWLAAGVHEVTGRFQWERLPEGLGAPRDTGIITLTVNGRAVPNPVFSADGQLWLQGAQRTESQAAANTLNLRVYRKIVDGVPLKLVTRLDLDVAGEAREVLLSGGLLPDFIPLSLISALPARLENDGALQVQLRPGRWQIELVSRYPKEVDALPLPKRTEPWPSVEFWSFEAHPEVRVVEIEGAPVVDPRQIDLPEEWKSLPAYQLEEGQGLRFRTLRRGDPQPEPDTLVLNRNFWLDFDGAAYTFQDRISGNVSRDWRLDVQSDLQLGRMEIDGVPQLITRLDERTGVEVRRGKLNLLAEGRIDRLGAHLPATGWQRDFQQVAAQLHLPPGWRLFAASGVDEAPGSWVAAWTLLDLFLVLIASLAVARLYGWSQAALALTALTLLWHEAGAPRLVWLHLLAASALLNVLPTGRAAEVVRVYRRVAALSLAVIALPFMVDQVRLGMYPQLEIPWTGFDLAGQTRAPEAPPVTMQAERTGAPMEEELAKAEVEAKKPRAGMTPSLPSSLATGAAKFTETDPNAQIQTGPGLPQWRWNRVALNWHGPVVADQSLGLYLISPSLNLLLNLARVVLLTALAWVVLRHGWGTTSTGTRPDLESQSPTAATVVALLAALFTLPFAPKVKADLPSPELLEELKSRLLAPADCLPVCAQIPTMRLRFDIDTLRVNLDIHVLETTVAVPLPAREGQWLPSLVELDGKPVDGLFRGSQGDLWVKLTPGRHALTLSGLLPPRGQTPLSLPLIPRRVEVEGSGWRVDGIGENGAPEPQLLLSRTLPGEGESAADWEARPLPPFLDVVRTLRFGLDWRIQTQVRRISPPGAPVLVDIPLLEGESVVTPGLRVKNGQIGISLAPGQGEMSFESVLEPRATVVLRAPDTTAWTELWQADVSPIWHLGSKGIDVTRHRDAAGNWLPQWQPWPGETVTLNLLRPRGAPGVTLTVESSHLELKPGERATDASLNLSLRSSQGEQQVITLPEDAELRSATIDGIAQPLRQQDRAVRVPIHPGLQTVNLTWRESRGITGRYRGSAVDLGLDSVNSSIQVSLGQDRWVLLTGGPRLGPAVLFWGVLAVIVVLAAGLGRLAWTPLKAWHWLLLLIGLSQIGMAGSLCVVGWLFALAWRERAGQRLNDTSFNLVQVGLVLLTLLAISSLFWAVQNGLLGLPDLQIAGNRSDAWHLNWYQDRSGPMLPRPWVITAPLWSYRLIMLLWALWLAYALLDWLRWGWSCYAQGGLWRAAAKKPTGDPPKTPDGQGWT